MLADLGSDLLERYALSEVVIDFPLSRSVSGVLFIGVFSCWVVMPCGRAQLNEGSRSQTKFGRLERFHILYSVLGV